MLEVFELFAALDRFLGAGGSVGVGAVVVPGLVALAEVVVEAGLVGFALLGRSCAAQGKVKPPISAIEKTPCNRNRVLNMNTPLPSNPMHQCIFYYLDVPHNASCAKNASIFACAGLYV
jgi:hypothetical protein